MLISSSLIGVILSVLLIFNNARKNAATLYLGGFFFLISLYAFFQYALIYSKSVTLLSILLFNVAIVGSPLYLIGPMLYWYIRSVLTDIPGLKRSDLWHLLPMMIFFIAALPQAFVPWQEKVELAQKIVENPDIIEAHKFTLLNSIFSPVTEFLSRPVLMLGYTLGSVGLFINYLIKKKTGALLTKQHFMIKWICLLLCFLLIVEITQIVIIIRAFEINFSNSYNALYVVRILSFAGLTGLLISLFFFPNILYGLPRFPETHTLLKINEELPDELHEAHKNSTKGFEASYLHLIGLKADSCMNEFKPYLKQDCNLLNFSVLVEIPYHHLAYYFREVKKQSFNDFRNDWRIKHAKNIIKEGRANNLTLEAIGSLSGFSSRKAFITSFRKAEGVTPGVFANQFTE